MAPIASAVAWPLLALRLARPWHGTGGGYGRGVRALAWRFTQRVNADKTRSFGSGRRIDSTRRSCGGFDSYLLAPGLLESGSGDALLPFRASSP
ncbi:hypothetical protein C8Q78DRAFT_556617 [Trametes maxima]|nr:hypothetical protein C8Q78DRAFT_556617 [Trametes maxima]